VSFGAPQLLVPIYQQRALVGLRTMPCQYSKAIGGRSISWPQRSVLRVAPNLTEGPLLFWTGYRYRFRLGITFQKLSSNQLLPVAPRIRNPRVDASEPGIESRVDGRVGLHQLLSLFRGQRSPRDIRKDGSVPG